jgi:hypothetical protein
MKYYILIAILEGGNKKACPEWDKDCRLEE